MAKFKIEKGVAPPRRGARAKYTNYEELYNLIPKMEVGDAIKITEVPAKRRNSAYSAINGVLRKELEKVKGSFYLGSTAVGKDMVEIRLYRVEDEPSPTASRPPINKRK